MDDLRDALEKQKDECSDSAGSLVWIEGGALNERAADHTDLAETAPEVTISVVMPNYNHAEFISTALDAVFAQEVLPEEIIVVDDGSTDESRALIEQWVSREPRIRAIFNSSNSGAIASINQGLHVARGKYVCLMAADDLAYPNFFSEALAALRKTPDVALFCAEAHVQSMDSPQRKPEVRPVIRPSNVARSFSPAETTSLLRYNDNFITPIAAVFRRSLILAEGAFDPKLGSMADGFLSRRLALKYGFCFSPKVVVRWQVRGDGLSRTSSSDAIAVRRMSDEARMRISSDPVFPSDYAEMFDRRWRFSTCRVALAARVPDWDFLRSTGPQNKVDLYLFGIARKAGSQIGIYLALIWLTVRYRPYSLLAMLETYLRRRWEHVVQAK